MKKQLSSQGLSSLEAGKLFAKFGPNKIESKKRKSLILQFLGQFKDFMVIILMIAAAIAFLAGEKIDGSIIFGIVILNSCIGFFQEFKAERAVEALRKMLSPKVRVLRDGAETLIDAAQIVPGDVLILQEGDKVSADCEILVENECFVEESILTGESVPVKKDLDKNKIIYMGTQIASGNAKAVVIHTGMRTEFGKIATLTTETKKDKSPLQKELLSIGIFVGKITIVICIILFLVGYFVQGRDLVDTLLFAVSVAVAAVPEGLPTTITVALALGVQRLARKNAIVKQLSSVETLGSTTVICTDKTGTLTKNEMTVQEVVLDGYTIMVNGIGYDPEGSFTIRSAKSETILEYDKETMAELSNKNQGLHAGIMRAMQVVGLCNNARVVIIDSQWKVLGDPTEGALITLAEKAGVSIDGMYKKYSKLYELPFDSVRKRMSVVVQDEETKEITAYVKGAPESILSQCKYILRDGKEIPLTNGESEFLIKHNELMAKRALRTIGLAYKKITGNTKDKYTKDEIESDLVFVGITGMADPPRDEVKEAVKLTKKAGIRVFVITGDYGVTAHAIAQQIGLVKSYGVNIITGEMLNDMGDEKLQTYLSRGQETIFARVSPEHKLRIVNALKQKGEVVAVTGDGVNDAPALKRADIGVAMGITGTDVSKEAANMVLTDDSFATIVLAIIEGRTIYENMKKFIYFIFSSNVGELFAIFIGISIGLPAPLTAIFMLIINTLTDVFPSLALGIEPVEKTVLEKAPRSPNAKIMELPFIRRCLLVGAWMGIATFMTFFINLYASGWSYGMPLQMDSRLYMESATMAFAAMSLIQMVHAFNSRSEKASVFQMKFFENKYLLAAISFTIISTVIIIQVPFFTEYIKTVPLSAKQWGILIGLSSTILFVEEIRKLFARRSHEKSLSAPIPA